MKQIHSDNKFVKGTQFDDFTQRWGGDLSILINQGESDLYQLYGDWITVTRVKRSNKGSVLSRVFHCIYCYRDWVQGYYNTCMEY